MIFKWESQKERLSRWMKISPRRKLEWLREMQEFNAKYSSKNLKNIRLKLRELR